MNEQEAIKNLSDSVIYINVHNVPWVSRHNQAIIMAIEALKKQIAKKPIEIDEREKDGCYHLNFICGSCLESVFGQPYRPSYCKHCGQKLDWGDKNEM